MLRTPKLIFTAFSVSINFNSTAPFKNSFLVPDLARRPCGGDFQQLMVVGSFHVGKLDRCSRIAMLVGSLPCWKASLLQLAAMLVGFFHVGNLGCCKNDSYVSGFPSMLESLTVVK